MCVSAAPARFEQTVVYAGEARRNGELVHVVGYQNTAQSLAAPRGVIPWTLLTRSRRRARTGNAMILHFPAIPGSMTQENVVDTESCPNLLRDMVKALQIPVTSLRAIPVDAQSGATVEVFESGIYTVVLAADARSIPDALDLVPHRKRPPRNDALFDWYQATFPGWPVALCCFDNTERTRAVPMLWWYRPTYPKWLFAPAVDAHTGAVPSLAAQVPVDHWVIAGSVEMAANHGEPVHYRDRLPPDVAALVPTRVVGRYHHGPMPNADFVMPVGSVRAGQAQAERRILTAAA